MLWAPLFLKQANQRDGAIDDTPLTTVDVLPTMTDALGVTVPWDLHGTSAFDPDADHPDDRPFYVFQAGQFQPNPDAVYETDPHSAVPPDARERIATHHTPAHRRPLRRTAHANCWNAQSTTSESPRSRRRPPRR